MNWKAAKAQTDKYTGDLYGWAEKVHKELKAQGRTVQATQVCKIAEAAWAYQCGLYGYLADVQLVLFLVRDVEQVWLESDTLPCADPACEANH